MFQRLARQRLREARALYAAGEYSGAYYLAGYVAECALKAVICKRFQRHTLPDVDLVKKEMYHHSIEKLLEVAKLSALFRAESAARPALNNNWLLVRDWRETARYSRTRKSKARDLIQAVGDGPDSFLTWVESQW